jgi:hypothetical protein
MLFYIILPIPELPGKNMIAEKIFAEDIDGSKQ